MAWMTLLNIGLPRHLPELLQGPGVLEPFLGQGQQLGKAESGLAPSSHPPGPLPPNHSRSSLKPTSTASRPPFISRLRRTGVRHSTRSHARRGYTALEGLPRCVCVGAEHADITCSAFRQSPHSEHPLVLPSPWLFFFFFFFFARAADRWSTQLIYEPHSAMLESRIGGPALCNRIVSASAANQARDAAGVR